MGPVIFLAFVGAGIAYTAVQLWLDWRRAAPLRREVQAQDVTFRIKLSRVKVKETYSWYARPRTIMYLSIRGDAFEISATSPLDRLTVRLTTSAPARRPFG